MPDQVVKLEKSEWQAVLQVLGTAQGPGINWNLVNPLLMRIGAQLQAQEPRTDLIPPLDFPNPTGDGLDSDGRRYREAAPGDGFDESEAEKLARQRRVPRN